MNIVLSLVVIYALYLLGGYIFQRRIVFPRHFTSHDPDAARQFPALEVWQIGTEGGRSFAWFLPGRGVAEGETAPAVVFAYGNADLAQSWAALLRPYRDAGIHVLLPEYRGYGFSDGQPSQEGIVRDCRRFYDKLAGHGPVDAERIFFHGRSLGGGVVCALSTERAPAALVLSSTFTSVGDMARRFLFPAFLIRDPFDNLKAVRQYDGPVLILHGREDELTPLSHARELARNAGDAELVVLPGDHNNMDPYIYGGEAWKHIFGFLARQGMLKLESK